MPWGPRTAETSTNIAEGDKLYYFGVYSGPSGSLTAFAPVYKDVSDAAEYGFIVTATKITAGAFAGLQSAGKVTVGSIALNSGNLNAGAVSAGQIPTTMGIYSPTNPADVPSLGDVVRIMRVGVTPVQISSGQNPAVGDYIIGDSNQNLALTRSNTAAGTPSLGAYLGRVIATGAQISLGQTITPLSAGKLGFLVNGWVNL